MKNFFSSVFFSAVVQAHFLGSLRAACLVGAAIISLSACSTNYVLEFNEDEGMKSGSWIEVNGGKETRIKASIDGPIVMNDAQTDIIEFPPSSELTVSVTDSHSSNDILFMEVVREGSGPVRVIYELNDKKVSRDALSTAQRQHLWTTFFRRTGQSSQERSASIVKKGGVGALLSEIEAIDSSFVKRRYIENLSNNYALGDDQVVTTIGLIRDITSNSESRRSFAALLAGKTPLSQSQMITLLASTNKISSNSALGGLLSDILEQTPDNKLKPALSKALLEASTNISSNNRLASFLGDMIERVDDQQTMSSIITLAGKNISSNNRLASLYEDIAYKDLGQENTLLLLTSAADNISSSARLAGFVMSIIGSPNFDYSLVGEITEIAEDIGSTSRKESILKALASLK